MKQRIERSWLSAEADAALPRGGGDGEALLVELAALLPPDRLLTRDTDLFTYECDGQTLDRALPLAVALPDGTAEVAAVVRACARHGVAFVARGAGTGLSGGAIARGSLVISTARMNRVLEVDLDSRQAWVEPGVVNAHLSRAVAASGLHYAPDPSSQNACTIGGNVAENAGGPHTLKYGVTTNHVLGLEVVLPDGTVARLGGPAADAPGYDVCGVLVGSEGTMGVVTRVLVKLTRDPEGVRTALAIFDSVADACRGVTTTLERGVLPAALELMDQTTLRAVEAYIHAGLPLDAAAVLLIEVDGLREELDEQIAAVIAACRSAGAREVRLATDQAERALLWKGRKQAFGALGRVARNYYTHDGVIPRTRLPEVLERIVAIGAAHGLLVANVFHAGDGNLHPVILFDEREPGVVDRVRAAGDAILRLVVAVGGAISGEHGIGLEKIGVMRAYFREADLVELRRLRALFDPRALCNPGKVLPAPAGCADTRGGALPSRVSGVAG